MCVINLAAVIDSAASVINVACNVCDTADCVQKQSQHVAVSSNSASTVSVFRVSDRRLVKSHELVSSSSAACFLIFAEDFELRKNLYTICCW